MGAKHSAASGNEKPQGCQATSNQQPRGCPVMHDQQPRGCPVNHGSSTSEPLTEQGLNPYNMMEPENQVPHPKQPFDLPKDRQMSTIPKGIDEKGNVQYWQYPSAQMMYNAMGRKGKVDLETGIHKETGLDTKPDGMASIVNIHNINNEMAWHEVLKWELLHIGECQQQKLISFRGNAKKYSPRARIRNMMGYELPFDRHDWMVDRCGKTVHYVIDYYDGPIDHEKMKFAALDVRPAMDSFGNVWDRMKVAYMRWRFEHSLPEVTNEMNAVTGKEGAAEEVKRH